jgi:hypothetical protein
VGDVGSTLFQAVCLMRENVLLIAPSVTDGQNLQKLFEHSFYPRLMLNSIDSTYPRYLCGGIGAFGISEFLLCQRDTRKTGTCSGFDSFYDSMLRMSLITLKHVQGPLIKCRSLVGTSQPLWSYHRLRCVTKATEPVR